jgi:hypothetical protein
VLPRLAPQVLQERREPVLDVLEPVLQRDEAPADVVDGHALDHHPLDQVDATHHLDRVEAGRAGVLALAADAAAAREQSHLDVLPERRLRRFAPCDRTAGPLPAGDASGPVLLDPLDLAGLQEEVHSRLGFHNRPVTVRFQKLVANAITLN